MDPIIEPNITSSEWEVMRVIWAQNYATSQFIAQTLSIKMNWKLATVKTLLSRLVKKNFIGAKKDGKRFLYYPLITEQDATIRSIKGLLNQVCNQKVGGTIAQLIQEFTLSIDDIHLIESTLKAKEPVQKVECNCIPGQCDCSK